MHYFIDGYNFLFQLYDEVDPLREKRDEVIEHLQEKLKDLNLNITIVFDNHQAHSNFFPTRFDQDSLEIIYTPSGQSADSYILEALTWNKHNHTETVITSDKRLATQIKTLGAKVQSIEHFIKWLLRKNLIQQHKKTEDFQETSSDFKRLLEIFEKKFKEKLE